MQIHSFNNVKMTSNEDFEIHELVKEVLERSGLMSKIRAELRASVLLALEDNGSFQNLKPQNNKLQNFTNYKDGLLLISLIREFLEYLGLSFTASVFEPELATYGIRCNSTDRNELKNQLNLLENFSDEEKSPLLYHVLLAVRYFQKHCDSENMEECSNLGIFKSTDVLTDSFQNGPKKETDTLMKFEKQSKCDVNITSTINNSVSKTCVSESKSIPSSLQTAIVNEIETEKRSLSYLDDLPPLTPQFSSEKKSRSNKQMNRLKAMLTDCPTDEDEILNSLSINTNGDKNENKTCQNEQGFEESVTTD